MHKKSCLGRGLDAIFQANVEQIPFEKEDEIVLMETAKIKPNKNQPKSCKF